MTLMTLNLGYGKGISSKQRHKRHLRHYRHARMLPGVWGPPRNAFVDIQTLCLQYTFATYSSTETVPACKSQKAVRLIRVNLTQIHSKILTRKSESDVDSLSGNKAVGLL